MTEGWKEKPFIAGLKLGAGVCLALAAGLGVKSCSEFSAQRAEYRAQQCAELGGRNVFFGSEDVCISRDGRILAGPDWRYPEQS